MQKRVTIKDIAKALGVSKSTVSRALSDRFDVNASTRESVLDMARRLNYKPNPYAQSLICRRSRIVGIVVPEFVNSFFPRIIMQMQRVFEAGGFRVLITQSGESAEVERRNLELLEQSMVEGIVISIANKDENLDYYRHLMSEGIPLVFFNRACSGLDADMVVIDDRRMAAGAVEHLITGARPTVEYTASGSFSADGDETLTCCSDIYSYKDLSCGGKTLREDPREGEKSCSGGAASDCLIAGLQVVRHRIMHLKGPDEIYSSKLRYEGYCDACRKFGLPVEESLVVQCDGITREVGYQTINSILGKGKIDAEAVFAFNDQLAIGALKAMKEHGLRVPEDIAIMGFSESQSALLTEPPLSSVAQPLDEIGETAARMLLEKIEHPERRSVKRILDAKLNIRESSRYQGIGKCREIP